MLKKITLVSCCASLLLAMQHAQAALISGSNYVTDTDTQLDWLHLSETQGMSYAQTLAETATGGQFEGWVFASEDQVRAFLDNAGGSGNYDTAILLPDGMQSGNNAGNMDDIYSVWGVYPDEFDQAGFWWGDATPHPTAAGGAVAWGADMIGDHASVFFSDTGHINIRGTYLSSNFGPIVVQPISVENAFPAWGSALVRPAVVPLPAAVWLFGFGVVLLAGLARRKNY